jgi:GrpB-like predicted nucleotidyltransferase (UPF0157 family)
VTGLPAKPVLDLLAPVGQLASVPDEVLVALGYVPDVHRPHEARWFWKSPERRTHQLHLTTRGSALWRERLAFRDALRASGALRDRYAALKLSLTELEPSDYVVGKRPFVAEVLDGAGVVLGTQ